MSTVVNTNVASQRGIANLLKVNFGLGESLERLSSGYKINKAADDASGMAISTIMSAQIGGIRQAVANAGDTISMIQTADGAYAETTSIMLRMRDLAVKAANDVTLTAADLIKLDNEFNALRSEITAKITRVTFNTKAILNGAVSADPVQVGPNKGQSFNITITALTTAVLKIPAGAVKISTAALAGNAISAVDQGISVLASSRAGLGTVQKRLNHIVNDLTAADVNLSAARSRVLDTDFASEISNFTKLQILQQVGTAVLAQANASPQAVIQLLG